jgi:dienelactone hydrolase
VSRVSPRVSFLTASMVGICLGGHLAFRAAMNPEVRAAVCFYATDIHSGTLGAGKKDDSLARASEVKGELLHIWGRQDRTSRSKDDGGSSPASTKLEPTTIGSKSTAPTLLCAMKVTATTQSWNIDSRT